MSWVDSVAVFWWSTMAPLSIQVAFLATLVALADRLLPRRTWPELRAALWMLVLLRLVLPPGLSSPLGLVGLLPAELQTLGAGAAATLDADGRVVGWARAIGAGWLVGVVALAGWGAVRSAQLRRRWSSAGMRATGTGRGRVDETLLRCGQVLALARTPRVEVTPGVAAPCVTGVVRPTVYLPSSLLDELSDEDLEHVLLHELAHVKRGDLWIGGLTMLLGLLYWFHPLVWLARRRLGELREQCCDRTVTRALGGHAEGYRRTLLRVAARVLGPAAGRRGPRPLAGLFFVRPQDPLLARLRLLQRPVRDRKLVRRAATTAALMLLLALGLPIAERAEAASNRVAELIDRPPGCLQLRYLVLQRLAAERAETERPSPSDRQEDSQ